MSALLERIEQPMNHIEKGWDILDFAQAMKTSITSMANDKILKQIGNKIIFNGFWRNGNKQNVCAWLDNATWHDAKTGEGGGCKEFAKVAFNMDLRDFMHRYGKPSTTLDIGKIFQLQSANITVSPNYVHSIWEKLIERDKTREDKAGEWLNNKRGIVNPRSLIGSGFSTLYQEDLALFDRTHHGLITQRLSLGPNLIAPIRDTKSDVVQNLFFRAISNVNKEDKSRLLTGAGGWGDSTTAPRSFGYPHLINEYPNIVLCEGMADYFAAEFLLDADEKYLPIGASNADALVKWADWLGRTRYHGKVCVVYQLDNKTGLPTAKDIGQTKAIQSVKLLLDNKIEAMPFRWVGYLKNTTRYPQNIRDLADSIYQEVEKQECGKGHLNEMFKICLFYKGDL